MTSPDLAALNKNAQVIVEAIGREAVDVYLFLSDEFPRGPVTQNFVFQFVYRSFYRLDNAGLTPEFKSAYFECMEDARRGSTVDIAAIVKELSKLPNLKGQESLQFSFVTKLASTINPSYPMYDDKVAKCFGFRVPYNYKPFDARLQEYLAFYDSLREFYEEVRVNGSVKELVNFFERIYSSAACRVPEVKVLDFIFWSAGKMRLTASTSGH
ncbi:MAG: hypothetical protein ABSG77_12380 [Candidatus Acidiferrum sp.]|jgi:hypothetical protein